MIRTQTIVALLISILGASCSGNGGDNATATSAGYSGDDPHRGPVVWTSTEVPAESVITGGHWTLEQNGTSASAPSAGYCVNGVQQMNPGTERMQPYYQPYVTGSGRFLQGYFDYRPKDNDEAIVAATSDDAGRSWTFQQQVLELTTQCPASDGQVLGSDDGQGHPFVLTVNGTTVLYTLDRSAANIDSAGLVVHVLDPTPGAPLAPTPAMFDVATRTSGLLNPDGIIEVVPQLQPLTVLYLQKQLGADQSFMPEQQCVGTKANHDITTVRLAQTDDGINFTDLGPVSGLNDSTDVTPTGTRYVGPRGTLLTLRGGRYGFFFSGGNCIDNDSDAFHYLGYAESTDLMNWTIVNDINSPIASIAPVTVQSSSGSITIPLNPPVAGATQGWFAGRVYGGGVTLLDERTVTMVFSGYHTAKPKNALGDYRTIGRVILRASQRLSM